jgi:hypothetical protein
MDSHLQRATAFPPQVIGALSLIAADFLLSIVLMLRVDVPLATLLSPAMLLAAVYLQAPSHRFERSQN